MFRVRLGSIRVHCENDKGNDSEKRKTAKNEKHSKKLNDIIGLKKHLFFHKNTTKPCFIPAF
jgi:hypothetical protein